MERHYHNAVDQFDSFSDARVLFRFPWDYLDLSADFCTHEPHVVIDILNPFYSDLPLACLFKSLREAAVLLSIHIWREMSNVMPLDFSFAFDSRRCCFSFHHFHQAGPSMYPFNDEALEINL